MAGAKSAPEVTTPEAPADTTNSSDGCAVQLERAQFLHDQALSGCQRQLQQSTDALDVVEQALVAAVAVTTATAPRRANASFPSYVPSTTSNESEPVSTDSALEYLAAVNERLNQLQVLTEQVHAQWLVTLDPWSALVQWMQSVLRSPIGNSWWDVFVPAGPRLGSAPTVNGTATADSSFSEGDTESSLPLEAAQLLPPLKWLRSLPLQSYMDEMYVVPLCFVLVVFLNHR